ncbi:MAG TPA: thiamine-phosphate kinase [Gemmatimonadaceae bacterium]|nr:thiamine-phosphate kinase [Gemmatimonadaceae bacterium]
MSDKREPGHIGLGQGIEFDLIRQLLAEWGESAHGIGDDAAIVQVPPGEKLVVTTDTSVDGIHFRREWLSRHEIAYRATAAALSDLAAMAARPLGLVVAITLPEGDRAKVSSLAKGIGESSRASGCPIVGGDLSSGSTLSFTITAFGSAPKPLSRAGARVGERVYVTGSLGGPAAAVRAWLAGKEPTVTDRGRFARPVPRIDAALALAERGASGAVDISDGLMADLAHVAAASGVHIEVDLERIPVVAGVTPLEAAGSGEEYELAVTAPEIDVREFSGAAGVPLAEIGRIVAGPPGVDLLQKGTKVTVPTGYDHFRRK